MMSLTGLTALATSCGYPLPEYVNELYCVSARSIYSALRISIPFAVWFTKVCYELECEKGADYTPIKHMVGGKNVKDYYVSLTVAGDMGLMSKTAFGDYMADFYESYKQALRWERVCQLEQRVHLLEAELATIQ